MPDELTILCKGYLAASRFPTAAVPGPRLARELTSEIIDRITTTCYDLNALRATPHKSVRVTSLEEYFVVLRLSLPKPGYVAEDLA